MAQKTGALIFDETADRYDIRFDIAAGTGTQDNTGRYFLYQVYRSCPGTAVRHYACLHTTF